MDTTSPFLTLLENRNSCRSFTNTPVSRETIGTIVNAAKTCPTAGNLQSYFIAICTDRETKLKIAQAALSQEFIVEAPVVLVFMALPTRCARKYHSRHPIYSVQDATIACTYAQLCASSMGLGSCIVGAMKEDAVLEAVRSSLVSIGKDAMNARPVAVLPIGYPSLEAIKRWKSKGSKLDQRKRALTYGWVE